MRLLALATCLVLLSGAAMAQTTAPADGMQAPSGTTPRVGHAGRRHMTLQQRFEAANTTQDGHLTLEQAQAGHMRALASHFSQVDTTNQGYVTLDQIHAYNRAHRRTRRSTNPPASTTQN